MPGRGSSVLLCARLSGCCCTSMSREIPLPHVQTLYSWSAASLHQFELQQLLSERAIIWCSPHALHHTLRFLCGAGCLSTVVLLYVGHFNGHVSLPRASHPAAPSAMQQQSLQHLTCLPAAPISRIFHHCAALLVPASSLCSNTGQQKPWPSQPHDVFPGDTSIACCTPQHFLFGCTSRMRRAAHGHRPATILPAPCALILWRPD